MIRIKTLFPVFILSTAACSDVDSEASEDRAVVEAYLRPGKAIEVTIFKEGLFGVGTIDTVEFINGQMVTVTEGENKYTLHSLDSGRYVSEEGVSVKAEAVYSLEFEYRNLKLMATTYVPGKPVGLSLSAHEIEVERPDFSNGPPQMPDPIEVSWSNPDNDYHMVVVTALEENPEPILDGVTIVRLGSFRNEPNTGTTYRIRPMDFEYYGRHAVVLCKLNAEYAALYEDTGKSSLNLKSPYSNITNGLGIFTALHTDTAYIEVKKP